MFGLVYAGFTLICHGIKGFNESIYNGIHRHLNQSNSYNYPMYIDKNGQWRDVKTDRVVISQAIQVDDGIHTCLCDAETRCILKDITAEKNQQALEQAQQNGATVVPLASGSYVDAHVHGQRYKDIASGDIYVSRLLPHSSRVYMNIKTLMFERPMDEVPTEQRDQVWDMIKRYNQLQTNLINDGWGANPYNDKVYIS